MSRLGKLCAKAASATVLLENAQKGGKALSSMTIETFRQMDRMRATKLYGNFKRRMRGIPRNQRAEFRRQLEHTTMVATHLVVKIRDRGTTIPARGIAANQFPYETR